jgi:hypothetical protein
MDPSITVLSLRENGTHIRVEFGDVAFNVTLTHHTERGGGLFTTNVSRNGVQLISHTDIHELEA